MKKSLLLIAAFAALAAAYLPSTAPPPGPAGQASPVPAAAADGEDAGETPLAYAFEHRLGDLQVRDRGKVVKLLPDDDDGSRHQRFILRLSTGQTVLVAHNIDLAPRVADLAVGDEVEFNGEYEWNAKGGVIHWTHDDPAGRHVGGWLRHEGRTYQ